MGRTDEAIREFRTAIGLRPDFVKAHRNLGIALASTGRKAEAARSFETVLRLDPEHSEARRKLRELAGG